MMSVSLKPFEEYRSRESAESAESAESGWIASIIEAETDNGEGNR